MKINISTTLRMVQPCRATRRTSERWYPGGWGVAAGVSMPVAGFGAMRRRQGRATSRVAGGRPGSSRALILLVCLVSAFWLISLIRLPRPARLVLVGAGYQANLQIPAQFLRMARTPGSRDARRSARFVMDRPGVRRPLWTVERPDPSRGRGQGSLGRGLEGRAGADDRRRDGPPRWRRRPGRVPAPSGCGALPEAKDRLRMNEVIRLFGSLPRSKKKVLILDATGMPYHWELGMLKNDFALELKKLEPEIMKVPNFVVISASDQGQRSWASDAWGRTAFLHFLTRALGGEADRSAARSGRAPGGRVNLEQVFDYLAIHVNNWAATHCNAPQEPLILPSGEAGRRVAALDRAPFYPRSGRAEIAGI